jgi:catechol 2,3-dioxygenase-like lactoylglutathione lyase family enzyme
MTDNIAETLELGQMDQVGFVVKDLDAAIAQYEPLFGPFRVDIYGELEWDYKGRPETSELKLAFGKNGDIEIELIEWVSGECPHKEFIEAGREGIHHLRYVVEDLDTALAKAAEHGYQATFKKRFAEGIAAAYVERDGDPLILEFYENHFL